VAVLAVVARKLLLLKKQPNIGATNKIAPVTGAILLVVSTCVGRKVAPRSLSMYAHKRDSGIDLTKIEALLIDNRDICYVHEAILDTYQGYFE
jgi:hypothetical protein